MLWPWGAAAARPCAAAALLVAWSALLPQPVDAAVEPPGFKNKYYQASGYLGSRVREYNETGRYQQYLTVDWYQTVGVDRNGRVWVVDRAYHQVLLMEPKTRYVNFPALYTEYAGGRGQPGFLDSSRLQARFDSPSGLAITQHEGTGLLIFVADTNNHCVRRLNFHTGRTSTVAGNPGNPGLRDGPGFESRLFSPMSIGVDATGLNLFVLDNGRRIRHVDLSGITSYTTTMADGACRSVSRYQVAATALVREVGCHTDWAAIDSDPDIESYNQPTICLGHQATCGPRNHPAIADSSSPGLLLPVPTAEEAMAEAAAAEAAASGLA